MADAEAPFSTLYDLLEKTPKLVLAVSGGADSTGLMVLEADWAQSHNAFNNFHVLTVDHGLRDSAQDEADEVLGKARALGFAATVLSWDHDGLQSGIQNKARKARYQLIHGWCQAHGFGGVVTAHTRNDQAETLLMRLARGSGVAGLAAMAGESEMGGLKIYRPLLDVSREQLRAVLLAKKFQWIEDPSNDDDRFERIKMRALLVQMQKAGIDQKAIALSAKRAGRALAALEAQCDDFMAGFVQVFNTGHCVIDYAAIQKLPEEIAIKVLGRVIDWAGSDGEYLKLAKLERLYRAIVGVHDSDDGGENGGNLGHHTLNGARIVVRKRQIIIGREFGRMNKGLERQVKCWDNKFVFDKALDVKPYGEIIKGDDRQRPDDLPHFVACALPAVLFANGDTCVPHLDVEYGITVSLAHLPKGVKTLCSLG